MLNKDIIKSHSLKAVIIGAGQIAAGFDNPTDEHILTHAHAYKKHKRTELIGFFDIDKNKTQEAALKWSCNSFYDLDQMFRNVKPDIVSICTPDESHFDMIKKVLDYRPALIICEKPATALAQDTEELIRLCKQAEVLVLVNFTRRFDKMIQELKKDIEKSVYGEIICASGTYSKGIKHNGAHMIDLACYLFGSVKKSQSLYGLDDYKTEDKTVAGFLQFDKCAQFHLLAANERKYSMFELDILFDKGRVKLFDSGFQISTQQVEEDQVYPGFFALTKPQITETGLKNAFLGLIDNAVENIYKDTVLVCDLEDALKTQKVCENLLNDLKV